MRIAGIEVVCPEGEGKKTYDTVKTVCMFEKLWIVHPIEGQIKCVNL